MSCEDGCRITEFPVMQVSHPPTSPPVVNPSPLEGVYTVSIPRPNTTDPLSSSDDHVEEVFLVQVEDQLGNETYFTMVIITFLHLRKECDSHLPFALALILPKHLIIGVCLL